LQAGYSPEAAVVRECCKKSAGAKKAVRARKKKPVEGTERIAVIKSKFPKTVGADKL
jgi:hypothetical protein